MRACRVRIVAALLVSCLFMAGNPPVASGRGSKNRVKNVILLIPDGCSLSDIVLTRWYRQGLPLAMDKYAVGFVRTYCADSLITDSAAAASAYATGRKIEHDTVAVAPAIATMPGASAAPPEDTHRPLPTVLEAARLKGLATGIVSSSAFDDATTAAFASHVLDRDDTDAITKQMVHAGIDVLLAGGRDELAPGPEKRERKDGENMTGALTGQDYLYVTDREGLVAVARPRVWGLFAPEELVSEFDRATGSPPDLAELTRQALRILSKDKDGFFLLVQSGEIDSFGHDNDPFGIISEVVAFDEALRVATDFAVVDGRTAVIACPDHATGGLSVENYGTLDDLLSVLKKTRLTSYAVRDEVAIDGANLEEVLARDYGLVDLTPSERDAARAGFEAGTLPLAIGPILAARAGLSFSTVDHTGEDVVLFAYHPSGFKPTDMVGSGVIQNVDINRYILEVLGLDLAAARDALHQPASLFKARGGTVVLDRADAVNPVVRVTRGRDVIELPVDKNQAVLNGHVIRLDGLVTVVGDRVWVPRQAIELLR